MDNSYQPVGMSKTATGISANDREIPKHATATPPPSGVTVTSAAKGQMLMLYSNITF